MGFLNKLLKGLGFEDEEHNSVKVENKKVKKEKVKSKNSGYATFDLNEEDKVNKIEAENNGKQNPKEEQQSEGGFCIIKVKTQVEVQGIIDKIKNGERVLINLTGMAGADITRSLDFLTGAVYALERTMQKVDGNVYIIQ